MILLQSPSRFLLQILKDRVLSGDKGVDIDCHTVEFDDVRYHMQFSMRNPKVMLLSVALPLAPPEAILYDGLPLGAIDAIKAAYGTVVQILDPPKDGFDLTMKINLTKLPTDEGSRVPFPRAAECCLDANCICKRGCVGCTAEALSEASIFQDSGS